MTLSRSLAVRQIDMKDMKEMKDDEDLQCWLLLASINCTLKKRKCLLLAVHVSPSPVPFFLYTYPYYASKEDWLQDDITQILEIKIVVFFFGRHH